MINISSLGILIMVVWFKYWRLTMNKINEKEYTRLKNGVLDLFETLAHSQGFYGRLIRDIKEAEASGVDTTDFFMQFKDCKSPVDIILKLECE